MNKRVAIIGAGATGLSAAYAISREDISVTVYEASKTLGGLAGAVDVDKQPVEAFYHHIFMSDTEVVRLADEIGVGKCLVWKPLPSGMYSHGTLLPFSGALDLLKYPYLKLWDRIRLGLLVPRAGRENDLEDLDRQTARQWVVKYAGEDVYNEVWGPLLKSKFDVDAETVSAAWLIHKFKLRGTTRKGIFSKELLGYMKGGFIQMYEALAKAITEAGGEIRYSSPVLRLTSHGKEGVLLETADGTERYDAVIVTTAPSLLPAMGLSLPDAYLERVQAITYKANLCLLVELKKPASPYYWTTVTDPSVSFVAAIEQTRMVPPDAYGGKHLLYLSRYVDAADPLFKEPDESLVRRFTKDMLRVFPRLRENDVVGVQVNRARYAQPVVKVGYKKVCLPYETPVDGVYLASMAQIYPEDRGQNYAIRSGREVAEIVKRRIR